MAIVVLLDKLSHPGCVSFRELDKLEIPLSDCTKEVCLGTHTALAVQQVADLGDHCCRNQEPSSSEPQAREQLDRRIAVGVGHDRSRNQRPSVAQDHRSVPAEAFGKDLIHSLGDIRPARARLVDAAEERRWPRSELRRSKPTTHVSDHTRNLILGQFVDELMKLIPASSHGESLRWRADSKPERLPQQCCPGRRQPDRVLGAVSAWLSSEAASLTSWANSTKAWALEVLRDYVWAATNEAPPVMSEELHPWVWEGAPQYWRIGAYNAAIWQALIRLNVELQRKIGRREVSEADAFAQAFTLDAPQAGRSRLRLMEDDESKTYQNVHKGAILLAQALYAGVRNPLDHDAVEDPPEQEALETMAAISLLARWTDRACVVEVGDE